MTRRLDITAMLTDPATRVVVCTGAGGVGKTTTAAAVALRAAELGAGGQPQHPDRGGAEDPQLVAGLVGARAAQLHGPVGREQQQRHPGVMGLERGRMEVRDRGPGRRHDRDGTPRPFREAEGEERGGTLVDPDVQAQQPRLVSGGQGVRQRRRA